MTAPTSSAAYTCQTDDRQAIPVRFRWDLSQIFVDWPAWTAACQQLETLIEHFAALRGTLARGPQVLLEALRLSDELGQLTAKVYYYPSLRYDEDQRDNTINAKRQQALILIARAEQASSWFNPELLLIPQQHVETWMASNEALGLYRFALTELYRQQEHVLDEHGERLLSLASRFQRGPGEVYAALTTADVRFPKITLSTGEELTVTHGRYRAILTTSRVQEDRAKAMHAIYALYRDNANTHAALYNSVCLRDWFLAQARRYSSTLAAALFGNNIPPDVVETLISSTREGVAPLRRYHRLRKRVLGLAAYHLYDTSSPLVEHQRAYPYEEVQDSIVASVAPLGADYQRGVTQAFAKRWIDVYESQGKRSGAYSAPVYGAHPYMLLNYNDTLDDIFTLAHEMGHSMHTILAHREQPFVYSSYTTFVAEVPSTLSEALLLEHLLQRSTDPHERIALLQHAIDSICGTFYTQVLFADWELRVHRLVEEGQPLTAEGLNRLYLELLEEYYGDTIAENPLYGLTWARIPHLFRTPYYVYQYATCFASSARLLQMILVGPAAQREQAVGRYLTLLRAGGSDHPIELLRRAGVDLGDPATIEAVAAQLDGLVARLEQELSHLG